MMTKVTNLPEVAECVAGSWSPEAFRFNAVICTRVALVICEKARTAAGHFARIDTRNLASCTVLACTSRQSIQVHLAAIYWIILLVHN